MMLLAMHYPVGELVEVPDRDKGDYGIEAFARDGCAFQCYAAEEPLTVQQLYAKQRAKMARDLKKLVDNRSGLMAILGSVRIRRWLFLVPRHDSKELVAHAARKEAELRAGGQAGIRT
jgi:hypothetical protein